MIREPGIVELTFVTQPTVAVENKDMRRGKAAIRLGDGLGATVVKVGEIECFLRGVFFHVIKPVVVFRVTEFINAEPGWVVRINDHQRENGPQEGRSRAS